MTHIIIEAIARENLPDKYKSLPADHLQIEIEIDNAHLVIAAAERIGYKLVPR